MSEVNPLSSLTRNSLVFQRNQRINQNIIDTTLERLSTGLRINHAADDPIGITIASRFNTSIISNQQAIRNHEQALNLADIAGSGAQGVLSNLQQIRSLILTSLSDTTSASDRARIQTQITKLTQDNDRLVNNVSYNSRKLIDGSSAGFRLMTRATSQITDNFTYTSTTTGNTFNFLTGNVVVDPSVSTSDTILFKTGINSSTNKYTLDVYSARLGNVYHYDDLDTSPFTFNFTLPTASGSGTVSIDRAPYDFQRITGPLTAAELNKPLQQLVNDDRIDPITYGTLDLGLGPNTSTINVTGSTSLNSLLGAINALSSGSNVVNASYSTATGKITISYTGQATNSTTTVTPYTIPDPPAAGGPYATFAAIPGASQGPAYRSITLPAAGFAISSPPANFPTLPGALNTSFDSTGTSAVLQSFFGLPTSTGNLGTVIAYGTQFYGETVATANPSEYVNRTRAVITNVTAQQNVNGTDTTLTTADTTKTFQVLNTGKVTAPALTAGDFTINFGDNGTFTFTGFDPDTHTIQDVVNRINAFGGTVGNRVSAAYDDSTDKLTISNTPTGTDNSITFGGANGSVIAGFFKLSNRLSTGVNETLSTVSSADIDNGSLDSSLDITAADVSGKSLNALRAPKISALVAGALVINGQTVFTVNPNVHTITDVVDAINNFTPSGNRIYTANFDSAVAGGLRITVTDKENLANATTQPGPNPNAASATLTANQYTLDTATYFATGAPIYQQPAYTTSALPSPYVTTTPSAPANVSAISFGGTSNIASVLFLPGAASGSATRVLDEYQGTSTALTHNSYSLTGNQRSTFQASSSTTSSQRLGYDSSQIDESAIPADGIIGEVRIIPWIAPRSSDKSVNFQIEPNQGGSLNLSLENLTSTELGLEGLKVYLNGDSDLTARLRGDNALGVVDRAIERTLDVLAQIGASQNILQNSLNLHMLENEHLNQALSDYQDANVDQEIANLTRAQINAQVGAAVFAKYNTNAQNLYNILFGGSGFNGF